MIFWEFDYNGQCYSGTGNFRVLEKTLNALELPALFDFHYNVFCDDLTLYVIGIKETARVIEALTKQNTYKESVPFDIRDADNHVILCGRVC